MELAKNRYSERYFDTNRAVEQEKIDKILEAGQTAPTACNYQPQRIYVIKSEEALKKLRSIRVSHFNAPLIILRVITCCHRPRMEKATHGYALCALAMLQSAPAEAGGAGHVPPAHGTIRILALLRIASSAAPAKAGGA